MIAEIQSVVDEQNPWPGLGAFDEAAQRFFNGRENEAATLRRLVLNAPLTVLFGASGLGKTSLIQAGLFPILRKEHFLPVRIRIDCRDRSGPLIDQVKSALWTEIRAWRVDATPNKDDEPLWHYLHRTDLELWSDQNQLLRPLLVLDQFEEVFTVGGENPTAISRLLVDLAELVENRIPADLANSMKQDEAVGAGLSLDSQHYAVLLSFREDFLPAVEGWKRLMPSILRNRLRLLPMSSDQAFRAVHDTAPYLVDEPLARRIVRFVAAAQSDEMNVAPTITEAGEEIFVEPALLSLVCDGLNEKRKAQQKPAIDEALLIGTGQSIVADFYERSVRDLPEPVQRFIENELITERGFRKPCDKDDARSLHGVTEEELEVLENRRLVRIEPQHGTERVELIHDLLTTVVREHRELQRKKDRVLTQRRELEQKRRQQRIFAIIVLLAFVSFSGILVAFYSVKARRAEHEVDRRNQEAAKLTQQENNRFQMRAKAGSLLQEGEHQRFAGKYQESLELFSSALQSYSELDDRKNQVTALVNIGDVNALRGSATAAEAAYTRAQQISKDIDDRDLQGKVLESLASLKERQNQLADALKYCAEANRLYQSAGDSQASGRVLERLAFEAEKSRSLGRAASLYENAIKNYHDSGDELGKIRAQQALDRIVGFWGFLVDLLSGEAHELKADTVNVGRNVEGVSNDISFSDRMVSRRHAAISRDLHIDDMRSRNGTTVNARLLPYGIGARLSDEDIIVLANVQPLQFKLKKPSAPLKIPNQAWAVFVDSESKSYRFVTGSEYFLTIEGKKLLLQSGSSDSGVLKLRRGQHGPQMFVAKSDWQLLTTVKETDYEYKSYILKTGEWLELYDVPMTFAKLSADGKSIAVEGPAFQFVLFPGVVGPPSQP